MVLALAGCAAPPQPPSATASAIVAPSATAGPSERLHAELCDPSATPAEAPDDDVLVFFTCVRPPAVTGVLRQADGGSDEARLTTAVEGLLAGPTAEEEGLGLRSWFSSDTAGSLRAVSIDADGVATVDLSDFSGAIPNASTTAGRLQLLSELRATIFQFDSVESAIVQFDGDCASFWIWIASNPCTPLTP